MSHSPTIQHDQEPHAAPPQARSVTGILIAAIAAAAISSLLTTAVLSRNPDSAEVHGVATAPAAPAATTGSQDTGVPAASTVFTGKDMPVDEPAPTF